MLIQSCKVGLPKKVPEMYGKQLPPMSMATKNNVNSVAV